MMHNVGGSYKTHMHAEKRAWNENKSEGNLGYVVILNEKGKDDGERNGQCKI